ncbi:MAG: dihydrolipoamide acetyltransferase family protein [Dehalococcoidales bacterium]|nr:dihydrolipoamide acetyltransferase family protein [Dehalococcoidales bacterium]
MSEDTKEPVGEEQIIGGKKVKEIVPLKGVRKLVSAHMLRSLQTAAQMTTSSSLDMTEIIKLRKILLSQEKTTEIHFTYTDLFVMVVAQALKKHPIMNTTLKDNELIFWDDINVGVALAFELKEGGSGLIVPVVRNADKKSLIEIHQTVRELTEKGRNRRLLPDEVTTGTFTLSNVGVFGGGRVSASTSTPILNEPQVALLGTGAIIDTPVVREGQIVIRPIMNYNLTFDHRVITGEDANKFRATLQQLMEDPYLLLLN